MQPLTMHARAPARASTGSGAGSSSRGGQMRERASFASPSADRLARRPAATRGRRRRDGGTRVEALAVIRLLKFDPDRVSVSFAEDTCRRIAEPDRTRRYTLTHNDLTQHLTLSVASDFNPDGQADVWYTRLLRDEVLAEWCDDGLHALQRHRGGAMVDRVGQAASRHRVPAETTLVLDTLRYAEADLLLTNPSLASAPVFVHFHEGPVGRRRARGSTTRGPRASASTGAVQQRGTAQGVRSVAIVRRGAVGERGVLAGARPVDAGERGAGDANRNRIRIGSLDDDGGGGGRGVGEAGVEAERTGASARGLELR